MLFTRLSEALANGPKVPRRQTNVNAMAILVRPCLLKCHFHLSQTLCTQDPRGDMALDNA